jgi:hypothetical protein
MNRFFLPYDPSPEEIAAMTKEIREQRLAEMLGKEPTKKAQAGTKEIRPARHNRRLTRST